MGREGSEREQSRSFMDSLYSGNFPVSDSSIGRVEGGAWHCRRLDCSTRLQGPKAGRPWEVGTELLAQRAGGGRQSWAAAATHPSSNNRLLDGVFLLPCKSRSYDA